MHSNKRIPSNTLPRNFTFHYSDNNLPQTPHDQIISEPPRQIGPYRVRRRKGHRQMPSDHFAPPNSRDIPIPTIEISDPPTQSNMLRIAPLTSARPRGSPPRTPVPQVLHDAVDECTTIDGSDIKSQGESISRPSTACSGFSDSSASSSIESIYSLGGNFTSPECDIFDHQHKAATCAHGNCPPERTCAPLVETHVAHSAEIGNTKQPWIEEMDNHLWTTYMRYLQDPRHTPFKMLPGTSPPLGVCSRVAREAKRTWKGRISRVVARAPRFTPMDQMLRADSPTTARQIQSGSATPTGTAFKIRNSWPRSDAATRRRLRELCKSKPTLSAHYNRLLTIRSPSPFSTSSSSRLQSSTIDHRSTLQPVTHGTSFSTRDMNLSLFSSTSAALSTMNQFTADSAIPQPLAQSSFAARTARHYSHQKSQSLHLGMGMGASYENRNSLASPFQPFHKASAVLDTSNQRILNRSTALVTQLASPLQYGVPAQTHTGTLTHHGNDANNESLGNSSIASIPSFDTRHSALAGRRVRNRAVSMGDVSASSRRLSLMFEPPSNIQMTAVPSPNASVLPNLESSSLRPPLATGAMRRLGSPFNEKLARPFNTFPRNFSMHGLETTVEAQEERPFVTSTNMSTLGSDDTRP